MFPLLTKQIQFIIMGVLAGLILYVWIRGFRGVGADIISGGAQVVGGAVEQTVEQTGEFFGIPETDLSECERAIAEGRTFDASRFCPAGRFLEYLFHSDNKDTVNESATIDPFENLPAVP